MTALQLSVVCEVIAVWWIWRRLLSIEAYEQILDISCVLVLHRQRQVFCVLTVLLPVWKKFSALKGHCVDMVRRNVYHSSNIYPSI